jgi:signal transduction histidine kinase
MIHDTVLGDLTAIMNAGPELDDRARERFRADVALLKAPTWLDSSALELDVEDAQLRNGTVALASEMQWRGLTVDVTGENDAVVPLTAEARAAVHEALRECLENVLRHSGETSAELVVGGDSNEVTYMVIDRGVGFDPDTVGVEHLGIRSSIVGRIEQVGGSVRIWSRHGSGTSVLISVPVGGDA